MSDETAHPALPRQPLCVVVCGLPGVGKTTVAQIVADYIDARHERSDSVRHDLFVEPSYNEQETAMVYDELLRRCEQALSGGESIVLDATFRNAHQRDRVHLLAETHGVPIEQFVVTADEDVVQSRLSDRDGLSDADFDVYQELANEFDPVEHSAHYIDNSDLLTDTRDQLLNALEQRVEQ